MAMILKLNERAWPAVTLLLAAAVTVLSLLPPPELPMPPGLLNDKVQHFLAHAAVAFPVALARPRLWPLLLLTIAGWGAVIELLQPHFGRERALADVAANLSGILAATAAAALLRRIARAAGIDLPGSPEEPRRA